MSERFSNMKTHPPKILKVYQGVTSGTMAGRDDGYPETKYIIYDNMEDIARNYGNRTEEEYFQLKKISKPDIEKMVKERLETQKDIAKEKKRQKLSNKIKELQEDLKALEN